MQTSPPLWQEPPVFCLPNVAKRVVLSYPSALAVVVPGIDGETAPQLFDSYQPEFIAEVHKFHYDPSKLVDEKASSDTVTQIAVGLVQYLEGLSGTGTEEPFMLFAYDLGGVVIQEVVPPEDECSTERLIVPRRGLLGPWVPAFIDWFSQHRQHLVEPFRLVASNFRVINITQDARPSSPHRLITHSSCATCGLQAEERTTWDRSHYLLGSLLGYQQQSFMERKLLNAIICHWQVYKEFLAILAFEYQLRTAAPKSDNNSMLLKYFLSSPATRKWMAASVSVPQPLHVELGRPVCSEEFFDSFESHITSTNEAGSDIILRLDPDLPNRVVTTEAQLYARLCAQLLERQPNLILWVRHLYPNLRDAVIGSDLKWRNRCLLRCLRTLLLTPKDGIVYCLIHGGPGVSRRQVISQVVAVTQESEIAFRLLISTEIGSSTDLGINSPCTRIQLASEGAKSSMDQDLRTRVQKLIERQPSLEPAKRSILSALNSEIDIRCMNFLANIMDITSLQSLPIFRGLDLSFSTADRISRCAENGIPWVIPVVAWIKYAIRPLYQAELKRILEVEWANAYVDSTQEDCPGGEILLVGLQRSLPELLWIRGGLIILRQDFGSFDQLWNQHLSDSGSPNKYIARRCLDLLENVFQNGARETQATGDNIARAKGDIPSEVLPKYATRYWMEHYYLANPNLALEDASFRLVLKEDRAFNLNAWVQYLASTYWSSEIGKDLRNKASPQVMEQVFGLNLFESSYLSYRIVTLPLSLEDDFDCILLGIASNILEDPKYYNMVHAICKNLSHGRCSETLTRVIAAAPENRRAPLFAAHDGFIHENSIQTLLTSIAVGNVSTVSYLLPRTPLPPPDETQAEGSSYLGTPLQVACEYGDGKCVADILKLESPWFSMEELYPWNALHVACQLGWADIVRSLGHLKWNKAYNPLLVTSGRGLVEISKSLADIDGLRLIAEPQRDESCSPTQLASKYGFLRVLGWLLDNGHGETYLDSHGNNTIRLALRSGNEEVGERILEYQCSVTVPPEFSVVQQKPYDDVGSSSDISDDTDALSVWETWEGAALVDAVECGSGKTVFDILLKVSDPDARDSKGRTPLIIAAMNGSVAIVERLLGFGARVDAKDSNGRTAMHHACDQGHMSIVEVLTQTGNLDPKAQDESLRTPLTAAIRAGHEHIVMALLPESNEESLKMEFVLAAANGQHHILQQILEFATDLNFKSHEEYVNARGSDSKTPLHHAAFSNYPRIVQFLLVRRAKLEASDARGMTPLAVAVAEGDSSIQSLKLLLDAGASTEVTYRRGRLPLTHAIYDEREAVVQLLLERGAKPKLCEYWSYYDSLLDFTILRSSSAVLKVLLEYFEKVRKSADTSVPEGIPTPTEALRSAITLGSIQTLDNISEIWKEFDDTIIEGQKEVGTVLHYAARYGLLAAMKWVWAQPNITSNLNEAVGYYGTPLQAAIMGTIDVKEKVNCLLRWGAEVAKEGGQTGTALHAAAGQLNVEVVEAILHRLREGEINIVAGQWGTPIQAVLAMTEEPPLSKDDVEAKDIMDLLISRGASVALKGGYWHTALHAAARSRSLITARYLLKQKDVSRDEKDLMGRLPLHLAAMRGNWEMVEELSSGKSDLVSEDHQGRNVFHMAAALGHLTLLDTLLENVQKADELINKADIDGWTPLHWSCRSRSEEVVQLLLKKGASKTAITAEEGWLPFHVAIYHGQNFSDKLKVDGASHDLKEAEYRVATCDCCRSDIFGTRYKCLANHVYCEDFDLCFKCYRHVSTIHFKDHNFKEINE